MQLSVTVTGAQRRRSVLHMKNKKAWIIGTAMGLSAVMLGTVAFAGTSATSGYDALKEMMRTHNAVEVKNATVDLSVSVTEKGQSLVNVDGLVKMDSEAQRMSGVVTVKSADVDRTITTYQTGTTGYLNVSGSDTWYQTDKTDVEAMNGRMAARGMHGDTRFEGRFDERFDGRFDGRTMDADPNAEKFAETFLDTIMGDLKNAVVLTENGAERTFSLKMDQSNMPELMKAALALGASHRPEAADAEPSLSEEEFARIGNPVAEAHLKALLPEMMQLHDAIDLSNNINVESIDISFTVDAANQPVSGNTTLIISGNTEDGTARTYTVDISMTYLDFGNTIPDTFEPEGKNIEVVQTPMHESVQG
jgi:hypothetical protein